MKRIIIALLLIMCLCVSVFAAQSRVVDNAGLLTVAQASDINRRIADLVDVYQVDIVIVTVDSIGNKSASAYADDFYDNNGYGIGTEYSGILLLISMEYQDWAISTCGDAIDIFPDRALDDIFSQMAYNLSDGEYYQAFIRYLDALVPYLQGQHDTADSQGYTLKTFFICLAIGAVVSGIVLLIMLSQMNTVKAQKDANPYMRSETYSLNRHTDLYLYSNIHKTQKAESGSSVHTSGGGRVHGGISGKF